MDVARVVLTAAVCVGFTSPVALAQTDDEVVAATMQAKGPPKPWRHVRGFGRVLDLKNPPIIIDEPGLYAVDRNWDIPDAAANVFPAVIQITAADVVLDLHGFSISADPGQSTLLQITGNSAEVRNGGLAACCSDGSVTIRATTGARLHHLSLYSYDTMKFEGDGTSFTDSQISIRVGMEFASSASVERNTIFGNRGSLTLLGDNSRLVGNTIYGYQAGIVDVLGDANLVANNVIDTTNAVDILDGIVVAGDSNVVRSNTVMLGGFNSTPVFTISGTANTLDGNIASATPTGGRAQTGMEFTADGNFYGNNRMAAQVPFALGGTVQTNWGGNVGY